jgi:hypothetical protein
VVWASSASNSGREGAGWHRYASVLVLRGKLSAAVVVSVVNVFMTDGRVALHVAAV